MAATPLPVDESGGQVTRIREFRRKIINPYHFNSEYGLIIWVNLLVTSLLGQAVETQLISKSMLTNIFGNCPSTNPFI
jgi:hypothetical protein